MFSATRYYAAEKYGLTVLIFYQKLRSTAYTELLGLAKEQLVGNLCPPHRHDLLKINARGRARTQQRHSRNKLTFC